MSLPLRRACGSSARACNKDTAALCLGSWSVWLNNSATAPHFARASWAEQSGTTEPWLRSPANRVCRPTVSRDAGATARRAAVPPTSPATAPTAARKWVLIPAACGFPTSGGPGGAVWGAPHGRPAIRSSHRAGRESDLGLATRYTRRVPAACGPPGQAARTTRVRGAVPQRSFTTRSRTTSARLLAGSGGPRASVCLVGTRFHSKFGYFAKCEISIRVFRLRGVFPALQPFQASNPLTTGSLYRVRGPVARHPVPAETLLGTPTQLQLRA